MMIPTMNHHHSMIPMMNYHWPMTPFFQEGCLKQLTPLEPKQEPPPEEQQLQEEEDNEDLQPSTLLLNVESAPVSSPQTETSALREAVRCSWKWWRRPCSSQRPLNALGTLVLDIPDKALLFSADAKSMYTNINWDIGIQSIRAFIASNQESIPTEFPSEMFLQILEAVMKYNIFSFGNATWLQLSGTAMGTPAAFAYATISYGQHENTNILPHFSQNLLY
jgi:hypothetical protein